MGTCNPANTAPHPSMSPRSEHTAGTTGPVALHVRGDD
ncbi:hypothetical protein ABMA10_08060 [Plantibacter sp. RU18]